MFDIGFRCRNCDSEVLEEWSFCPGCGSKIVRRSRIGSVLNIGLEDVFNRLMINGMSEAQRIFDSMHAQEETAHRHHRNTGQLKGMTVRIFRSQNMPPLINVERFESDEHAGFLHGAIGAQNNASSNGAIAEIPREKDRPKLQESMHEESTSVIETLEPKIEIMRLPGRIVIEAALEGVGSLSDIELIEFDESVEIRANAGSKKYLKIIQIPPEAHIKDRTFSGGILRLEVGK